jgi:hypothetical protein
VQKGKGVTSITGEKLYESQVLAAVGEALRELGLTSRFVMMLADEENACYRLHVEPDAERDAGPEAGSDDRPLASAAKLAELVDRRLAALNLEYRSKRSSLRLKPVDAVWLRPGAGDAYQAARVAAGQREAQFKLVALARLREFTFDLAPWARA